MTDKCAPHPWVKAESRLSNGRKMISFLLILNLCTTFAPRDIPDTHANKTRITSVICLQQAADCLKTIYNISTHHNYSLTQRYGKYIPMHHPRGPNACRPRVTIGGSGITPLAPPCAYKHRARHPHRLPGNQKPPGNRITTIK